MLEFTLPMPPSVNQAYRAYMGRVIKSKIARQWEDATMKEMMLQGKALKNLPLKGRLSVEYRFSFKDNRRRDVANHEKLLSDFLEEYGIFQNDDQIDEMHLYRDPVGMNRVLIKVREIE